ncbi:hypothetical protein TNCV_3312281 [Trichonephila clavipes]|nr:hypothetical protein TNCV_3312281 [Trichonephila clavipes]
MRNPFPSLEGCKQRCKSADPALRAEGEEERRDGYFDLSKEGDARRKDALGFPGSGRRRKLPSHNQLRWNSNNFLISLITSMSLDPIDRSTRFIHSYQATKKSHIFGLRILMIDQRDSSIVTRTATAGSDAVQSGRPIFDDFFQHLWPYIGNNTANVVFQMVKRFWLIRIDQ